MITHNVAAIAARGETEAAVILLLFLSPILVVCTWLIIRATRKLEKDAATVVRSVEESNLMDFLEKTAPAVIRKLEPRRLNDKRTENTPLLLTGDGSFDRSACGNSDTEEDKGDDLDDLDLVLTLPDAPGGGGEGDKPQLPIL